MESRYNGILHKVFLGGLSSTDKGRDMSSTPLSEDRTIAVWLPCSNRPSKPGYQTLAPVEEQCGGLAPILIRSRRPALFKSMSIGNPTLDIDDSVAVCFALSCPFSPFFAGI